MRRTKDIIIEYITPICHVMEILPEGVLCSSIESPDEIELDW